MSVSTIKERAQSARNSLLVMIAAIEGAKAVDAQIDATELLAGISDLADRAATELFWVTHAEMAESNAPTDDERAGLGANDRQGTRE